MANPPTVPQIFLAALRLGCTSFGGPVAHLGYFRRDYVERRRWIDEEGFAELLALCQFLPGPASSQFGFGLGHRLRGWAGGLAAWLGFTLPSAALMIAFALGLAQFGDLASAGWLHGLKLAAVAVVAHAVVAMWRALAGDVRRSALVLASAAALLLLPLAATQLAVIATGALAGWLLLGGPDRPSSPLVAPDRNGRSSLRTSAVLLAVVAGLAGALPALAHIDGNPFLALAERCYQAGALVFGGGHVVLPLLEREFVAGGAVTADQFLAGYGAAQALPGPLFAFAGYLGAVQHGVAGGAWATFWIFLPGLLLVPAALPLWQRVRHHPGAQAAMRGANATVVGLLVAAFVTTVCTPALRDVASGAVALVAFGLLHVPRVPSWGVVLACAAAGIALG